MKKLIEQMTRNELVVIYAFGIITGLIKKGIITGPLVLTEKGEQIYKLLQRQGFELTEEEYEWAVSQLMGNQKKDT